MSLKMKKISHWKYNIFFMLLYHFSKVIKMLWCYWSDINREFIMNCLVVPGQWTANSGRQYHLWWDLRGLSSSQSECPSFLSFSFCRQSAVVVLYNDCHSCQFVSRLTAVRTHILRQNGSFLFLSYCHPFKHRSPLTLRWSSGAATSPTLKSTVSLVLSETSWSKRRDTIRRLHLHTHFHHHLQHYYYSAVNVSSWFILQFCCAFQFE